GGGEAVGGGRGDGVAGSVVLQRLPGRALIQGYLSEIGRVLGKGGRGYVQIPVLSQGIRPRLWRVLRGLVVPFGRASRDLAKQPSYRGYRLTEYELASGLEAAGLRVTARDESPDSPYRYAREVFLRLEVR